MRPSTSPTPSAIVCFGESGDQIRADLFEAQLLVGVDAEEGAADAGVFVDAGGGVGAAAGAEFDFAVFEVVEELVPFGVGDVSVFVAGSLLAAASDEGAVVFDDVVVVDGDVALSGVEVGVAEDLDDRPAPEDAFLFEAEVAATTFELIGPHHPGATAAAACRIGRRDVSGEGLVVDGEGFTVHCSACDGEEVGGVAALLIRRCDERCDERCECAGALLHPGAGPALLFVLADQVPRRDRVRGGPLSPAGGSSVAQWLMSV